MSDSAQFGGAVSGTVTHHSQEDAHKSGKSGKSNKHHHKGKKHVDEAKQNEAVDVKVTFKHAFGSHALNIDGIQSYATLLGDKDVNDRLIYRVGKRLSVQDPDTGLQTFFTGRYANVTNILHFSISFNSKWVCVCETVRSPGDKDDEGHPQASVYSLNSFIRSKTFIPTPTAHTTHTGI